MRKYLFIALWVLVAVFLIAVSSTFRNKEEAMVAVVESQVTAVTFQRPVIMEDIKVVPGQEVRKGDTLLRVIRPDLTLDIEKKENELQRLQAEMGEERRAFAGRRALLQLEKEAKIKRLQLDKAELEVKLSRQKKVVSTLASNTNEGSTNYQDTLSQMKIRSIEEQMIATVDYNRKELERLTVRLSDKLEILESDVAFIQKELQVLEEEFKLLSKTSTLNGIIGTVNAQLDELVQPYTTILSIYERRPTLIKAYMNEEITYPIKPGDKVEVVSENRLYKIVGTIKELGARVVSYPTKIQPLNQPKKYGQEVFIEIAEDNRFLNGEKVFVYPSAQE